MKDQNTINLSSPRVYKSRYAKRLSSKNFQSIVYLILSSSILLAAYLAVFVGSSLWGFGLIPGLLVIMLYAWNEGELKDLGLSIDNSTLTGQLSPQILANLKTETPSAYEIWQAVANTNDRWFFQNRYILHHSIFEELLSKDAGSATAVWQNAFNLQKKYQTIGLPASVIIVSLLKSIPDIEKMLRHAKLELSEIEEGIEWLGDIDAKRRRASEKQRFGGLARDWAYGYTPILRYLGHNISEEVQYNGFFVDTALHSQVVDQMVNAMGSGTSSVTLVGDIGSGKTTVAYAFAERLIKDKKAPKRIKNSQIISLDAPTLLSSTRSIGELEGLVMRLMQEARRAKNIILFFDDAQVFFGQGAGGVDISNVLQSALDSGSVRLIFALTPKEWQNVGSRYPAVASKLQPLQVQPAGEKETINVLRDQVLFIEYQKKVLYTQQALNEAYKLASRYVDNQVMPGAALSVLEAAAPVAKDGYVTDEVVQQSIESSIGVKIQQSKGDESQKLLNLEDDLHKYVINQKQAVSVIANALRRSRSGVGNPDRPVGTFLFLGPTGVGKTELSKALARVYFGSEKSMIRVDMNQFVNPQDVTRLITPMLGEQLGLLGQIKKQPFSVVLLDEIEKAHPSVINLLLQTLDEGVMRDVDNKPVSFKDAIIIATSNAGADEIRKLISGGEDPSKLQSHLVDTIIERQIFAPEFVNRFDEVVVFRSLTQDELVQVIDLIITGINKTMDKQKVQVELTSEAKRWLVEKGYDAKLGARPMRRVVQKYVENILAKRILEQSASSGSVIKLDVADFTNQEDV